MNDPEWWSASVDERPAIAERIVRDLRADLQTTAAGQSGEALLTAAVRLGFVAFAIWMMGEDERLHCRAFASTVPMEVFEEQTRMLSFAPGEGLPGRTWGQLSPVWIPNVIKDDHFPRLRGAIRDLIRSVVAIPLVNDHGVVAVLELFARRVVEPDEALSPQLMDLGAVVCISLSDLLRSSMER